MNKFLGFALIILSSSPVIAHAKAAKAASIQSISAKYAGSNLEKRMLLRDCREAGLELAACSKKLVDLSSADVDQIKEALAEKSQSAEQASSASAAEEEHMVSSKAVSVNVSSGNGNQQSSSTTVTSTGADCVARATQNVTRVVSSLNARMAGRFANKK